MLRVLLINPPIDVLQGDAETYVRVPQPIGLAYLAAVLEQNGHDVKIVDALACAYEIRTYNDDGSVHFGLSHDAIAEHIRVFAPKLIGVSIVSTVLKECAYNTIRRIKNSFPGIPVIAGGAHVSVQPDDVAAQCPADYLCLGEGELTLASLVDQLDQNVLPEDFKIPGLCCAHGGKVSVCAPSPAVQDLDSLPFPARHLLPMDQYFEAARKCMSMFFLSTANKRWATIVTSRGCPYSCVFCSIHLTAGRKWRARSAVNLVNEIEQLIREYKIQHIAVIDDNMTLNRDRMVKILDEIERRGLVFEWSSPNGMRADSLDRELLVRMKKLGCRRTCVAPESGSQYVVDKIVRKNQDLKHVENVIKWCREIGLAVDAFFVIGFIDETVEQIRESISFAKHLRSVGASGILISVATPFPGTELYENAKSAGLLDLNASSKLTMFESRSCMRLKHITQDELERLRAEFIRETESIPWDYLQVAYQMLKTNPGRLFHILCDYAKGYLPKLFRRKK